MTDFFELNTKAIYTKTKLIEIAWDALCLAETKIDEHFQDTHNALVLSADRIMQVYEEINAIPAHQRYIKPKDTNQRNKDTTYWKQCALSLADELGYAVPAIFSEASYHDGALQFFSEELSECFVCASVASASMIAGHLGEDGFSCGLRMKENLAKTSSEHFYAITEEQ